MYIVLLYIAFTSAVIAYLLTKDNSSIRRIYNFLNLAYRYIIFRFNELINKKYILTAVTDSNIKNTNVVEKFDNYMTVSYFDKDDGKIRKVFLPLRMDNVLSMNECKIEAFYSDEKGERIVTIKQDPEIPVLVTASSMGAKYILVHNVFNGEEKIFKDEEKVECFTAD